MICIRFFHAEFCKQRETNARKRKQDSILTDYIRKENPRQSILRAAFFMAGAHGNKKTAVKERQSFFFPFFPQMLPPARIRHILLTGKVLFA